MVCISCSWFDCYFSLVFILNNLKYFRYYKFNLKNILLHKSFKSIAIFLEAASSSNSRNFLTLHCSGTLTQQKLGKKLQQQYRKLELYVVCFFLHHHNHVLLCAFYVFSYTFMYQLFI